MPSRHRSSRVRPGPRAGDARGRGGRGPLRSCRPAPSRSAASRCTALLEKPAQARHLLRRRQPLRFRLCQRTDPDGTTAGGSPHDDAPQLQRCARLAAGRHRFCGATPPEETRPRTPGPRIDRWRSSVWDGFAVRRAAGAPIDPPVFSATRVCNRPLTRRARCRHILHRRPSMQGGERSSLVKSGPSDADGFRHPDRLPWGDRQSFRSIREYLSAVIASGRGSARPLAAAKAGNLNRNKVYCCESF